MSLLYECINTVIAVLISISSGMPNHSASIQLCVQKLRILIEDSDQNLKYLGLLAMSKILKTHPKSVQAHKDLILACLDDKDESIRLRALDLLYGMVSKKNLMEIVGKLLGHMERAEGSVYRDELLYKVIEICSQGSYQYVTNFEWYLIVLVELIQLEGNSRHGAVIATQLLDVSIRVHAVRAFAVKEMTTLLTNFPETSSARQNSKATMFEVLYAAAWIVGEFSEHSVDLSETLSVFLRTRPNLPGHIQAVFVQNMVKIFARIVSGILKEGDDESSNAIDQSESAVKKTSSNNKLSEITKYSDSLLDKLPSFLSSSDIEVQERASSAMMMVQLLKYAVKPKGSGANQENNNILEMDTEEELKESAEEREQILATVRDLVAEINNLFSGDLNPVAPKAQRKVPVPEGLDLDRWINEPLPEESDEEEDVSSGSEYGGRSNFLVASAGGDNEGRRGSSKRQEPSEADLEKMRESRRVEQRDNPNYLKGSSSNNGNGGGGGAAAGGGYISYGCEEIPIAEIALEVPLQIQCKKIFTQCNCFLTTSICRLL